MERLPIIIIIVILLGLAIFFFPRECGSWGTLAGGAEYRECSCIGLKLRSASMGGGPVTCYGIPASSASDYCYKLDYLEGRTQEIEIPCE